MDLFYRKHRSVVLAQKTKNTTISCVRMFAGYEGIYEEC